MKLQLKKSGMKDFLRTLLLTLDKEYAKEMETTFFRYLWINIKKDLQGDKAKKFSIIVNNKFAGNIGFFNFKKTRAEVGYSILRKYRRKGLAIKTLSQALEKAKELDIKKITAITDIENIPSQKVLSKNKFKKVRVNTKENEIIWEIKLK